MLTADELRTIKEAVYLAYRDAALEASAHNYCPESCLGKQFSMANLAKTKTALDLIDRELNKE